MDELVTHKWSEAEEFAHSQLMSGNNVYIEEQNLTGNSFQIKPDDYIADFNGEFPVKPEDFAEDKNNHEKYYER